MYSYAVYAPSMIPTAERAIKSLERRFSKLQIIRVLFRNLYLFRELLNILYFVTVVAPPYSFALSIVPSISPPLILVFSKTSWTFKTVFIVCPKFNSNFMFWRKCGTKLHSNAAFVSNAELSCPNLDGRGERTRLTLNASGNSIKRCNIFLEEVLPTPLPCETI